MKYGLQLWFECVLVNHPCQQTDTSFHDGQTRTVNIAGTGKPLLCLLLTSESWLTYRQGRSPYDDVVEGTGEGDPHEPQRQYDEKGRIMNPETKQRIKNVIRAHNEVMQVIGVAEPENSGESSEVAMAREHQAYESETGRTLLSIGRSLGILGIWGVHGVRQRIMVCSILPSRLASLLIQA